MLAVIVGGRPRMPRERLIALFWPTGEERARTRARQVLYDFARTGRGPSFIDRNNPKRYGSSARRG